jgi:head-tail adaptor
MRAGKLDRLIDIQRADMVMSPGGEPTLTWANVVTRRAASYAPVAGSERFSAPQLAALEQVEFRIRYSQNVAELMPQDRIIYPSPEGSPPAPITERQIYNIIAVNEIGRREGLAIMTVRRADVVAP